MATVIHGLTYGAELELSDWPRDQPLAPGQGIDTKDVTMVNSSGVAVDPRGLLWPFGGEIQTAPTHEAEGQAEQLADIMRKWPETTVNYRSNLHVHVHVPQLREHLPSLKAFQRYVHQWMPGILQYLEPIPTPQPGEYKEEAAYLGAMRRFRRRRVSHHQLMKSERLRYQMEAETVEEFRDREYKDWRTGALHPAIHPRLCVNLRQLWETDTIEFRHFPGTTDPRQLLAAVEWCREFVRMALRGDPEHDPRLIARGWYSRLPRFLPYDHWLETGYEMTSVKFHDRATVRRNIEKWLEEQRQLEGT